MTNQTLNVITDFELDEPWMHDPLWQRREPGRGTCTTEGPEAHCWGLIKCHGYFNGCSCRQDDEQFNRDSTAGLQSRRN